METLNLYAATVPAGECPRSAQDIVNLNARYLYANLDEAATRFVKSATTPSADDQDKMWAKFDANGVFVGWFFFYNGAWRKFQNATIGDIKLYDGPTAGVFDATGKGVVGGDQDGWCLCNGNNGAPDWRDRFPIAANQIDSGTWKTNATGSLTATGGSHQVTLTEDQIPEHYHRIDWEEETNMEDGGSKKAVGSITGEPDTVPTQGSVSKTTSVGGGEPHDNMPPYIACAAMRFMGYA